jgi:predicted permease
VTAPRTVSPHPLALRLLKRLLPDTTGGRSILGDVTEEFHRRPPGLRRRAWLWWTAADLAVRYAPDRLALGAATTGRDLIHAFRLARRFPALIAAALLSLALAIGVCTAAFSIVNGIWLRYRLAADPAVVDLIRQHGTGASVRWPESELFEIRERTRSLTLEAVLGTALPWRTLTDAAPRQPMRVHFVTADYFDTFGAVPAAGRLSGRGDDRTGAPPPVVLSHLVWRRDFGGKQSTLGSVVLFDGIPATVIGVAGRDFVDPSGNRADAWMPLATHRRFPALANNGSPRELRAIGRLRDATALTAAERELQQLVSSLGPPPAPLRPARGAELVPVVSPDESRTATQVVAGVVLLISLVLVLACANVANLQMAGGTQRQREIATRLACGATLQRIVRQLVTEGVTLALLAGVLGLLLASWLVPAVSAFMGLTDVDVAPDLRVYLFTVVVTACAAVASVVAPARAGTTVDVARALKGLPAGARPARSAARARSALVGLQAAASIVLLAVASLLVRTLVHLTTEDPGFDVARLVVATAAFPRSDEGGARAKRYWADAKARVAGLPGVEAASIVSPAPLGITLGWERDDDDHFIISSDADFFAAAGLMVVRGRAFTAGEVATRAPVALVSERLARRLWNDDDPIGSSLGRFGKQYSRYTVIGLVGDVSVSGPRLGPIPVVVLPFEDSQLSRLLGVSLLVRTADPAALVRPLGAMLTPIANDVAPTVWLPSDRYDRQLQGPRELAALAAGLGAFALMLAAVGLFGVTAFAVRSRTREIGIRMALGARRGDLTWLMAWTGLRATVAGLAIGLVAAVLGAQVLTGMLYGVSPRDPIALAAAAAVLLATATLAAALPCRRAARADPASTLRES